MLTFSLCTWFMQFGVEMAKKFVYLMKKPGVLPLICKLGESPDHKSGNNRNFKYPFVGLCAGIRRTFQWTDQRVNWPCTRREWFGYIMRCYSCGMLVIDCLFLGLYRCASHFFLHERAVTCLCLCWKMWWPNIREQEKNKNEKKKWPKSFVIGRVVVGA